LLSYIVKKEIKKSGKKIGKVSPNNFLKISQNGSLVSNKMSRDKKELALYLILMGFTGFIDRNETFPIITLTLGVQVLEN